jgi:MOSC domain-containing protein YiiM
MKPDRGTVLSVNVTAVVHEAGWTADKGRTGIDKRSVKTPVNLEKNAVEGDVVADRKNHGGYDQAVYAYSREDAEWWEGELGETIAGGRFGENLTTQGIDVSDAVIGERWQIGSAILEVAQPRTPCRVFAGFWNRPNLIKEFTDAGRPGAYLRIIQEGQVRAGNEIVILGTPMHGIRVSDLFAARGEERFQIFEILVGEGSSQPVRQWASRLLVRK